MVSRASPTPSANPASILFPLLSGGLLIVLIACAALSLTPSIASAFSPSPTATAEQAPSWSVVEISKPTQTPPPTETPIIPTSTPDPATMAHSAHAGKYILVSLSEQHLYAYENGDLIFSFVVSTGMRNSTRIGTFRVLDKIANAYADNWNFWMPNWMGIYWAGTLENGIHALPVLSNGARVWSGYLGTPISYGCVVLGVKDAAALYNWADVGTTVEIQR